MAIAEFHLSELASDTSPLEAAVDRARAALLAQQNPDGCWSYPLEADSPIPAD